MPHAAGRAAARSAAAVDRGAAARAANLPAELSMRADADEKPMWASSFFFRPSVLFPKSFT
jgi:hypothetical protein